MRQTVRKRVMAKDPREKPAHAQDDRVGAGRALQKFTLAALQQNLLNLDDYCPLDNF